MRKRRLFTEWQYGIEFNLHLISLANTREARIIQIINPKTKLQISKNKSISFKFTIVRE